ncbi:unnamed protein product [Musa acuminata subsp. malaccensis]|uniref:Carbonic anhydrase n=1 Tax=Musa acuminata subsp. malaccensis TaxID=214687 RepID=A0A8D7AQW2_MUSAM|nr:unnamed protein product [Musa acuminata subsp. malaccensis]
MAMACMKAMFSLEIASLLVACAYAHDFIRFGYGGATGPEKWGSLSSEFKLCSAGKHQSPINIVKDDVVYNPNLKGLDRDYVPTNATFIDNGFNVELRYEGGGAGKMTVDGKNYSLLQMHWHSPSEHTINGERFPVELHLVHKTDCGDITVVSILYRYGHPDAFLIQYLNSQMRKEIDELAMGARAQVPVGIVRTRWWKRHSRKYYRYVGSLTTPPCTENVIWSILGKVREMSEEQASALKAPLEEEYRSNSRPLQPLNGQTVQLYDERRQRPSC